METLNRNPLSRNKRPKSGSQTVLWWICWIVLTIVSFFIAAAIWTPLIARYFGSIRETNASVWWVVAVFSTWMVILFPLIVVMYHKVDKAYEDARIKREKAARSFRSTFVETPKRLLPFEISAKLADLPETLDGGHLVTAVLRNGQRIPHVFIARRNEIIGIYDAEHLTFEGKDVADIEPVDWTKPPQFFSMNWLRLDGAQPPQ